MFRVYFLQQRYGLADEALENALHDSQALQRFARMDLAAEGVPEAPTLLNFRHLLETHDLSKGLFTAACGSLFCQRQRPFEIQTLFSVSLIHGRHLRSAETSYAAASTTLESMASLARGVHAASRSAGKLRGEAA